MTQLVMSPAADDNVRMLDVSDTQYCLNINMFSAWVVQVQWRENATCCLKAIALTTVTQRSVPVKLIFFAFRILFMFYTILFTVFHVDDSEDFWFNFLPQLS